MWISQKTSRRCDASWNVLRCLCFFYKLKKYDGFAILLVILGNVEGTHVVYPTNVGGVMLMLPENKLWDFANKAEDVG